MVVGLTMEINQQQVKALRAERGWTQQQLAEICALSLRTVQRVEVHGLASHETVNALAGAFQISRASLLPQAMDPAAPATVSRATAASWPLYVLLFGGGVLTGAAIVWSLG
jgi:transcriptional regulator with XRE-family HTH domain